MEVEPHYKLSDTEFARAFESCELDPGHFSHEAHLRLAWTLIRQHGLKAASERLCKQIRAFDQVHGSGTKYNRALTLAAARMVSHYQENSRADEFKEFINSNPALLSRFGDLIPAFMPD